ncbi:NPCBM/NEW2 domain-containing protein [Parvularcula oceani]|uniref:NPCBM/NEW2 domain-containing protein n=1 Tax=Parvularcula oceani TaxID=1247963 RepID=UPI00192E6056|nr:NPCBM/NEW2 domain-containing protein [Parvularcula oceani]
MEGLEPAGRWTANERGDAALPPMGWNTWNAFFYDIDEEKVLASAQIMLDSGLAEAGYRYVNLDEGWWSHRRQPDGRMIVNTERFPSAATADGATSFKPFTNHIHAMGLKTGIYTDIGRNTCGQAYGPDDANLPQGSIREREVGLYGHIEQDVALFFEEWGFDYIKVDGCGIRAFGEDSEGVEAGRYRALEPLIDMASIARTDIAQVKSLFTDVAEALAASNRDDDYIFSVCLWGAANVRAWAKEVGNVSRTSNDITPDWTRMLTNFDTTVSRALYAQPHSWNDPDMLFVGQGEFDADHMREARSHFALWAIVNAPLLIGYDLREATDEQLALLGNREIIALNQDPAGHQAVPVYNSEDVQILVKTLANGEKGVAIFNRGLAPIDAVLTAEHLKMNAEKAIVLRDLWNGDMMSFTGEAEMSVEPRETLVFRASGERALTGGIYLSEMPGDVNVAEDGIEYPAGDPTIHRSVIPWTGTRGSGEIPTYAGWGGAQADRTPFGLPLRLDGEVVSSGIGILANSRLEVRNGGHKRFAATVGVDDSASLAGDPVVFSVYIDGELVGQTEPVTLAGGPVPLAADIEGARIVELVARSETSRPFDLPVVWGEARLLR